MSDERTILSGMLSHGTTFRIVASGPVSDRELGRLIEKMRIDFDILKEDAAQIFTEATAEMLGIEDPS